MVAPVLKPVAGRVEVDAVAKGLRFTLVNDLLRSVVPDAMTRLFQMS